MPIKLNSEAFKERIEEDLEAMRHHRADFEDSTNRIEWDHIVWCLREIIGLKYPMDKAALGDKLSLSMMDDRRSISHISWGPGKDQEDQDGYRVGFGSVTEILIYPVAGQRAYVPWVAVFAGSKLVARADCSGATIVYES